MSQALHVCFISSLQERYKVNSFYRRGNLGRERSGPCLGHMTAKQQSGLSPFSHPLQGPRPSRCSGRGWAASRPLPRVGWGQPETL